MSLRAEAVVLVCTEATEPVTQRALDRYCRDRKWTCVADLTAKKPCAISAEPAKGQSLEKILAKECPSYGWKRIGDVRYFGPSKDADSELNVAVGPFDTEQTPGDLFGEFVSIANLPASGVSGEECGGPIMPLELHERESKTIGFKIRRGSLRSAMMQAARQFGPSFWMVDCFMGAGRVCNYHVDDYYDLAISAPGANNNASNNANDGMRGGAEN